MQYSPEGVVDTICPALRGKKGETACRNTCRTQTVHYESLFNKCSSECGLPGVRRSNLAWIFLLEEVLPIQWGTTAGVDLMMAVTTQESTHLLRHNTRRYLGGAIQQHLSTIPMEFGRQGGVCDRLEAQRVRVIRIQSL